MLEREPLADLWKNTLSRIPTVTGRMVYLSGLRDPNSGAYRHHGLSQSFGREESGRALLESHQQLFGEWLRLPLAAKFSDLKTYFETLEQGSAGVAASWLRLNFPATMSPVRASRAERALFLHEMALLLETIRNQFDAGGLPRQQ